MERGTGISLTPSANFISAKLDLEIAQTDSGKFWSAEYGWYPLAEARQRIDDALKHCAELKVEAWKHARIVAQQMEREG